MWIGQVIPKSGVESSGGRQKAGPRVAANLSLVETCRRLKIPKFRSASIFARSCHAWLIFPSIGSQSSRRLVGWLAPKLRRRLSRGARLCESLAFASWQPRRRFPSLYEQKDVCSAFGCTSGAIRSLAIFTRVHSRRFNKTVYYTGTTY